MEESRLGLEDGDLLLDTWCLAIEGGREVGRVRACRGFDDGEGDRQPVAEVDKLGVRPPDGVRFPSSDCSVPCHLHPSETGPPRHRLRRSVSGGARFGDDSTGKDVVLGRLGVMRDRHRLDVGVARLGAVN